MLDTELLKTKKMFLKYALVFAIDLSFVYYIKHCHSIVQAIIYVLAIFIFKYEQLIFSSTELKA